MRLRRWSITTPHSAPRGSMRSPANPVAVAFAMMMILAMVVMAFALGLTEATRRGIPVWLLGVVGVGGFTVVAVQAWRTPPPHRGDRRLTRWTNRCARSLHPRPNPHPARWRRTITVHCRKGSPVSGMTAQRHERTFPVEHARLVRCEMRACPWLWRWVTYRSGSRWRTA